MIVILFSIFSIRRDVSAVGNLHHRDCEYNVELSAEAQLYLERIEEDIAELIECYLEQLNIVEHNCSDICFEKEFVIYKPADERQEQKYYVPIACDDDILLTVCLYNVNSKWTFNLSEEYVKALNDIEYIKDPEGFIFYESENGIVAESENETVIIEYFNDKNKIDMELLSLKYEDKRAIIWKTFENAETIITDYNKRETLLEGYSRAFGYYDSIEKRLALYNAQGQGEQNLCWAASCATIINFIKGTSITAKNVADKMGISYSAGATIEKKQNALAKYGIYYSKLENSQLTLARIASNIKAKYPIAVSAHRCEGFDTYAHAFTLYGYKKQYLIMGFGNEYR